MDHTSLDNPADGLEEKLSSYWQLVDERDAVQQRIETAKREKDTVNDRVYLRVVGGYESELESIVERLEPLKEELDALRRNTEGAIKDLEASVAEVGDAIAEAEFRHRVGEFDDGRLADVTNALQPQMDEHQEKHRELLSRLDALDRRRSTPEPAPEPTNDENFASVAHDEPEVEAAPAGQPDAAPVAPEPDAPVGDDEAKWATPWQTAQPETAEDDADPLAALADPDDRPAAATRTMSPTFPNLVIRSGDHAGKIVPLLPMTMSIGREHDNNIELKDPEVARYHARVVYEDGKFFVEDLESSTGTWVNGESAKRRQLEEGDVIRIGGCDLAVEYS